MGNFDRGGNRGGGRDRRGGGGFDRRNSNRGGGGFNRDRGDRPSMHKATCDACKSSCEVPFKPTGNKPIFCSSCFEKQGGGNRDRGGDRNQRPRFEDRSSATPNNDSKEIMKGIKALNYKLDELLKALSPNAHTEKSEEKVSAPKKLSKKKVTKKIGKRKDATPKKVVKKKTPKKKPVAKKPVKKKAAKKK